VQRAVSAVAGDVPLTMPDVEAIEFAFEAMVELQRQRLMSLIELHGWERGARIFGCARPHVAGVSCICGAPAPVVGLA